MPEPPPSVDHPIFFCFRRGSIIKWNIIILKNVKVFYCFILTWSHVWNEIEMFLHGWPMVAGRVWNSVCTWNRSLMSCGWRRMARHESVHMRNQLEQWLYRNCSSVHHWESSQKATEPMGWVFVGQKVGGWNRVALHNWRLHITSDPASENFLNDYVKLEQSYG